MTTEPTSRTDRCPRHPRHPRHPADSGQATTEYALVLLGAAAIALVLVGWASKSGGGIGGLLDSVIRSIATGVR